MPGQYQKFFLVILILVLGLGIFLLNRFIQPSEYRLPNDPLALEALELVKNHRSRQGYTLAEAIRLLVKDLEAKDIPFREGDWQVASQDENTYVVRKIIREKGSTEWIEREYAWRVDVEENSIRVISLAAQQIMPFENLPPLPHGDQISLFPMGTVEQFKIFTSFTPDHFIAEQWRVRREGSKSPARLREAAWAEQVQQCRSPFGTRSVQRST